MASPIIWHVLKSPKTGGIIVTFAAAVHILYLVPNCAGYCGFVVFPFLLGAYNSIHGKNIFAIFDNKLLLGALFIIATITFIGAIIINKYGLRDMYNMSAMSIIVWASGKIPIKVAEKIAPLSVACMFVLGVHFSMLGFIGKALLHISFLQCHPIGLSFFNFVMTLTFSFSMYFVFKRVCPKFTSLVSGGR